jgi:putative glutamine amidotransferase
LCIAAAVRLCGARPVQLRPGDTPSVEALSAVVISGGHDVEPVLYKKPAEVEGNYDADRDAFESEVIDAALERGRPLLGICRGAQLLNVRRGGDLFQDLRSRHPDERRRRSVFPVNRIEIESGSVLASMTGRLQMRVNRLHNQSVDTLGKGLRVAARDAHDIVQGIEDPERPFLIGVQWHPEFLLYQPANLRLFRALVDTARTTETGV